MADENPAAQHMSINNFIDPELIAEDARHFGPEGFDTGIGDELRRVGGTYGELREHHRRLAILINHSFPGSAPISPAPLPSNVPPGNPQVPQHGPSPLNQPPASSGPGPVPRLSPATQYALLQPGHPEQAAVQRAPDIDYSVPQALNQNFNPGPPYIRGTPAELQPQPGTVPQGYGYLPDGRLQAGYYLPVTLNRRHTRTRQLRSVYIPPVRCAYCGETDFEDQCDWQAHLDRHEFEFPCPRERCNRRLGLFPTAKKLAQHVKEQHSVYYMNAETGASASHRAFPFWWACEVPGCAQDFIHENTVHHHMARRHQGHTYVVLGKFWMAGPYVRAQPPPQVDNQQQVGN